MLAPARFEKTITGPFLARDGSASISISISISINVDRWFRTESVDVPVVEIDCLIPRETDERNRYLVLATIQLKNGTRFEAAESFESVMSKLTCVADLPVKLPPLAPDPISAGVPSISDPRTSPLLAIPGPGATIVFLPIDRVERIGGAASARASEVQSEVHTSRGEVLLSTASAGELAATFEAVRLGKLGVTPLFAPGTQPPADPAQPGHAPSDPARIADPAPPAPPI